MKARCILFTCLVSCPLLAQPGALNLTSLIDLPVAKTYPAGNIATEIRLYSGGGLLSSVAVGLTDHFSIGISYGGSNLIGTGRPDMNPQPCVQARVLLFEEQMLSPGVLLGFDSQGLGGYLKSLKRYLIRSKGIYAVAGKNTSFLGGLGIHAGVNWSLENTDTANPRLNLFIGCHKWIHPDVVALLEYDADLNHWQGPSAIALNGTQTNGIKSSDGKGLLNAAVRWSIARRFFFELSWKNILENDDLPGSSREIKLVYLTQI